jgi:NitT/TauT family transport system ATP-binding protein
MFLKSLELSFKYGLSSNALNGISFGVKRGETLGIVGASGCGKSTLLRIISGILPAFPSQQLSGELEINGTTALKYRSSGNLSFMFQEPTLMPNLNVGENIAMPLRVRGDMDTIRPGKLMESVGLSDHANFLPKALSGGMRTRVALARSFVSAPKLLLLDEPFSALDIGWKSTLYQELEELRAAYETTVVMVTHDVQEALLLSNQIIVLSSSGQISGTYTLPPVPVKERIANIPEFMKTVYTTYMLPIQEDIINGRNKKYEGPDMAYSY